MKKSSNKWIDCANVKLLQVDNFSVSFTTENGSFQAVNAISFEVKKGEIFAIIGESGSGKSVLCQSLTRLINKAQVGFTIYRKLFLLSFVLDNDHYL